MSTGFISIALVFGHDMHGDALVGEPLQLLADYVSGFRLCLYEAGRLAQEQLQGTLAKMEQSYERVGVRMLSLNSTLSLSVLPLFANWPGPAQRRSKPKLMSCSLTQLLENLLLSAIGLDQCFLNL